MATERMIVWAGVGQPELARRSATGIEPASLRRHPLHPRRRSRREAPRVRYGVSPSSARCLSENAANRYWHMIPCSTSAAWHSMSISASRCSTTNGASGSARPPRVARTSARRPRPALPVGSLIQGHLPSSGLVGRKAARRTGPSRSAREKRRLPDAAPQPKEYLRPGGIERRVGQQAPPFDLDQDGRPAAVGEPDASQRVLGSAACSSAQSSA
jgi:hypothetical protein